MLPLPDMLEGLLPTPRHLRAGCGWLSPSSKEVCDPFSLGDKIRYDLLCIGSENLAQLKVLYFPFHYLRPERWTLRQQARMPLYR
jgi:hypothetical protein